MNCMRIISNNVLYISNSLLIISELLFLIVYVCDTDVILKLQLFPIYCTVPQLLNAQQAIREVTSL